MYVLTVIEQSILLMSITVGQIKTHYDKVMLVVS